MGHTRDKPSAAGDSEPRVVKRADFVAHDLHGSGAIRRAIYPDTVGSRALFVGLAEFGPQTAPHVWHRHTREVIAGRELCYAENFEEFYFVVAGRGEMQWRLPDGVEKQVAVDPGDAVYFPPGVVEHRVFNTGTGPMRVLYGGTPPASVRVVG